MSVASVQEFLSKVSEDPSLQEEIATSMNAEDDREAVTKLAKLKGYDFTSDELAQEIENRQADLQERQAAGELSDEELEAVAGGEVALTAVVGTAIAAAGLGYTLGSGLGGKIKW